MLLTFSTLGRRAQQTNWTWITWTRCVTVLLRSSLSFREIPGLSPVINHTQMNKLIDESLPPPPDRTHASALWQHRNIHRASFSRPLLIQLHVHLYVKLCPQNTHCIGEHAS